MSQLVWGSRIVLQTGEALRKGLSLMDEVISVGGNSGVSDPRAVATHSQPPSSQASECLVTS